MKAKRIAFIAAVSVLMVLAGIVAAADQPASTDAAAESTSAAGAEKPNAVLPQPVFEFEPVVDGTEVTHDFPIKNTGTGMLSIQRVKTGWGCSVASYPRQIPAGGEGSISIKVNTSGYGGRTLKKNIQVFTSDIATPRITLSMTGKVLQFARLEPPYARLVGPAGTRIEKAITITRQEAYPFNIVQAKAKNGKDIEFQLEDFTKDGANGYKLTITNKKSEPGRYADTLVLTTDSDVKPHINVRVYGQITAATPQPDQSEKE